MGSFVSGRPLFSIVTVVYNDVNAICKTIDSVVSQEFESKEYIVIDGGSHDGTQQAILGYENDIDYFLSEADDGIADAFNKGILLAKGQYISFINSGDCYSSNKVLANVAEEIEGNDRPFILYGDCDLYTHNDDFIKSISVDYHAMNVYKGHILPHPTMFTSREYFEAYGVFDVNFKIAMDFDWMIRGIFKENVVHIKKTLANVLSGGVSTRNRSLVVDEIISALVKNGYLKTFLGEFRCRLYFYIRYFASLIIRLLYIKI